MSERSPLERKQEKINDPQAWLMNTGRFKRFEYSTGEETKVSGKDIEVHFKAIEPNIPEEHRWMLEALINYIKGPLVVDKFESEADRNAWQTRAFREHPELIPVFDSDKFRSNIINNVTGVESLAEAYGWLDPDLIKKRLELIKEYEGPDANDHRYHHMSSEEKIAFAKKMADFAKELYLAISKQFVQETIN